MNDFAVVKGQTHAIRAINRRADAAEGAEQRRGLVLILTCIPSMEQSQNGLTAFLRKCREPVTGSISRPTAECWYRPIRCPARQLQGKQSR